MAFFPQCVHWLRNHGSLLNWSVISRLMMSLDCPCPDWFLWFLSMVLSTESSRFKWKISSLSYCTHVIPPLVCTLCLSSLLSIWPAAGFDGLSAGVSRSSVQSLLFRVCMRAITLAPAPCERTFIQLAPTDSLTPLLLLTLFRFFHCKNGHFHSSVKCNAH